MNRVSRRKFLSRAALAFGAAPALLAAACQPTAAPPPATNAPAAPAAPAPTSAAPAAAAAPKPAATQAPATLKGASLSILEGSYFIKEGGDLFKKQLQEWGEQNGVKVNVDFLSWPDLQPKIGAAIQAGGLDIVELWPGWNQIYKNSLVDVTDIANEVGERGGGWEEYVKGAGPVDGRWLGVSHGESNASIAYRISWVKEAIEKLGMTKFKPEDGTTMDMTWDEYFAIGKYLKQNKQKPFGQALGHSTGDPQGLTYPYMWSHGAMEVEKDGKTVAFNKPEFVDAMKKFIQAWKDAYVETGTSWDDNSNNRAYLSEELSSTYNGSSIYYVAMRDFKPVGQDTNHMLMPKGPSGRFYRLGTRTLAILKNSKNVEAAKEFLKWWFQDKQYGDWFHIHEGYMLQNTKKWANDPMWDKDPKMKPFKDEPKYGRDQGYAGPNAEKAGLVYSKYIIVDTFAKAVTSGDAKASIEWGAEELKRIYGA